MRAGGSLEVQSNLHPRWMIAASLGWTQNPAYRPAHPYPFWCTANAAAPTIPAWFRSFAGTISARVFTRWRNFA